MGGSERGKGGQSQGAQGGLGGDVVLKNGNVLGTNSKLVEPGAFAQKGPVSPARQLTVRPSPVSPDDEKSRKGHGNTFPLPSPRAFQGQEGEGSWGLDAAGYREREERTSGCKPPSSALGHELSCFDLTSTGFRCPAFIAPSSFCLPGYPGRAVMPQMVTRYFRPSA